VAVKKRAERTTKALQVRLGSSAHDTLKRLADMRGKKISEIIREALEIYSIGVTYASQGKHLIWEDERGAKTVVLIPGFTAPPATLLANPVSNREH